MATMTTDESTQCTACQGKVGDAEDSLYTARNKLADAIDAMTALMAAEKAIPTQTDATRENYNQTFMFRAKLRECHGETIALIGHLERVHAEGSLAGTALWSNFGASYIYGGRPR